VLFLQIALEMKKFVPILFLIFAAMTFFSLSSYAQEQNKKVIYHEDPRIAKLIEKNRAVQAKKKGIDGYRVQIHFGANRNQAKEIKSKFLSLYPDIEAYEMYQQPNFKIRVGDCRTRFEADKLQNKIAADFPNSFVVQDIVNPKLNTNERK
jgi:hypothetical protein